MGATRQGIPMLLARHLCEGFALRTAIETGSYRGDSAQALTALARDVWSIELSAELHQIARQRFLDRRNLHFVQGSSTVVLPEVMASADGPALFWLDGHWSGGETAGVDAECPVLDELSRIDEWEHGAASCILIDDARLFLGPPPPPHVREQWPSFIEVVDKLRSVYLRYVTVLDDVIIAGPPEARQVVEDYWLEVQTGNAGEVP